MRRIFDALSWFVVIAAVSAGVYYTNMKSRADPSSAVRPAAHRQHLGAHTGACQAISPDEFEADDETVSDRRSARVF